MAARRKSIRPAPTTWFREKVAQHAEVVSYGLHPPETESMSPSTTAALTPHDTGTTRHRSSDRETHAYPVRDYIGAMADELARLARFDGDEALAVILEAAANRAAAASTAS